MTAERGSWIGDLIKDSQTPREFHDMGHRTISDFLFSLRDMKITPVMVEGDCLVIGPGTVMPERALLFSPESDFRCKRPGVRIITCCDSDVELVGDEVIPLPKIYLDRGEIPMKQDAISFFKGGAWQLLQHLPAGIFNTILALRISDLQETFFANYGNLSLLSQIARALRKGGYFIGSGSFQSTVAREISNLPPELSLIQYQELDITANAGSGFLPFNPYHMGIILKKNK